MFLRFNSFFTKKILRSGYTRSIGGYSQSEAFIDKAVVKLSEGALSTTTHAAAKLSGYVSVSATDVPNTTVEFYTKIIAKDNKPIRLNSEDNSLSEFNSFGTIQLIEI